MESGRVLKRSSIVLFLFQSCKWQPNGNQMTTQMAICVSSCDELKMGDLLGRHGTSLGTSLFGGK